MCWVMHSCNSAGCTDLRSSIPLAGFYDSSTEKAITADSLLIYGVGAPDSSFLAVPSQRIGQVYLPVNQLADSTAWVIEYCQKHLAQYGVADTIKAHYTTTPWLADDGCGAMYRFRISNLHYTRNIIDSIAVTDSLVTNLNNQTFKIFLRTQ